jgi:hypothetical protein
VFSARRAGRSEAEIFEAGGKWGGGTSPGGLPGRRAWLNVNGAFTFTLLLGRSPPGEGCIRHGPLHARHSHRAARTGVRVPRIFSNSAGVFHDFSSVHRNPAGYSYAAGRCRARTAIEATEGGPAAAKGADSAGVGPQHVHVMSMKTKATRNSARCRQCGCRGAAKDPLWVIPDAYKRATWPGMKKPKMKFVWQTCDYNGDAGENLYNWCLAAVKCPGSFPISITHPPPPFPSGPPHPRAARPLGKRAASKEEGTTSS